MNIFALDMSPKTSAQMMMDSHVIKMPTESNQMINTILDYLGVDAAWRPVMLNHPCTIWARQTSQNFQWLREHCLALCKEYTVRYGRKHKVEILMEEYSEQMDEAESLLPDTVLTPFAIAMDDRYRIPRDSDEDAFEYSIRSYRHYYLQGKWKISSWKTQEPEWWPNDHYLKMSLEFEEDARKTQDAFNQILARLRA
tara:strand:- start:1235 stop:1825 length:591 start_codon:yes stop_codon:yes gene_type:complete